MEQVILSEKNRMLTCPVLCGANPYQVLEYLVLYNVRITPVFAASFLRFFQIVSSPLCPFSCYSNFFLIYLFPCFFSMFSPPIHPFITLFQPHLQIRNVANFTRIFYRCAMFPFFLRYIFPLLNE